MKSEGETPSPRARPWFRGLRPLVWWILLVLALYASRVHERLLNETHLRFDIRQDGAWSAADARITLDGVTLWNGQQVPLGRHRFQITHPKAEPFYTNLFVWYGERDLGKIVLRRTKGTLSVAADPPAPLLTIHGPEFNLSLTNSPGMAVAVPTDRYVVTAQYTHWQGSEEVDVSAGATTRQSFAPKLGALRVECNQAESEFELRSAEGQIVSAGTAPATVSDLPAAAYKLTARHHGDQRESGVSVIAGQTNAARVDFVYGTAILESEPSGATIATADGREWGRTPLQLRELRPGEWPFTWRLDGYLSTNVTMEIAANQTNNFRANLVKRTFALALDQARQAITSANYAVAITAAREALLEEPGNSTAGELLRQARVGDALKGAEDRARQADYAGALQQVEGALALAPEHEAAKQLAATYKKALEDNLAKADKARRQEAAAQRERRAREYFQQRMQRTLNSSLFDQQEIKVKGTLATLEERLKRTLTNQEPVFKLVAQEQPDTEMFFLQAKQSLKIGGWRRCDLVGGPTRDGEVTLVFKVFEYAYPREINLVSLALGNTEDKDMVPIHPSRVGPNQSSLLNRRADGIRLVQERVREAAGE